MRHFYLLLLIISAPSLAQLQGPARGIHHRASQIRRWRRLVQWPNRNPQPARIYQTAYAHPHHRARSPSRAHRRTPLCLSRALSHWTRQHPILRRGIATLAPLSRTRRLSIRQRRLRPGRILSPGNSNAHSPTKNSSHCPRLLASSKRRFTFQTACQKSTNTTATHPRLWVYFTKTA